TWAHSIRSLKSGGTLVVAGATTGDASSAGLAHIFFRQLSVVGATMGTRDELERLIRFCVSGGIRPHIHAVLPLGGPPRGLEAIGGEKGFGEVGFRALRAQPGADGTPPRARAPG